MRNHTEEIKFFARLLIWLIPLTALGQVAGAAQTDASSSAAAVPSGASASAQWLHLLLPEAGNTEQSPADRPQKDTRGLGWESPGAPLFLPAVTYDTGGNPGFGESVAVADLKGDGRQDLVVASSSSGTVGVLLGNGDGTFQPVVSYRSGGSKSSGLAVADVNGDGKPDAVVANLDGTVGVLLGKGDGTFQPPVTYASGGGPLNWSVVVADVNGDRRPDLVVTHFSGGNNGNGSVSVLLGNGDGTFRTAVTYDSGGFSAQFAVVADVNGDGKPDLLVANRGYAATGDGLVGVLLGNGDGTFRAAMTYDSGGLEALSAAVADVNGDGKPDLVVANLCPNLCVGVGSASVLLGNGDGTFHAAVSYGSGGHLAFWVAVADVNGDGKPDLVLANECAVSSRCEFNQAEKGSVGVLLGNGDGTFKTAASYGSAGYFAFSVAVADVNGDGRPDLLVTNDCVNPNNCATGSVGVLLNNGTLVKSTTSTSLISSLNPSIYGQKVTWTARVSSSGSIVPTGKVTFTWGYTIGSATLNSSGVAILTKSNLNADPYPLTGVYSGDAANLSSRSAVLNQVVLQTTSTATLTSSPNPSTQGQAITITAKVSSPTVVAKGTVTFTAGKMVLGTAQLSSGVAKLTISSLAVGSTKITATYYGDSNISQSSASVTQTVH